MQEQAKNFEIGILSLSCRGFLNNVHLAHSHLKILKLDEAFSKGDFKFIMEACRMPLDSIFSNVVEGTQEGGAHTVKKKACNAHQIWCATFVPSGTPYMA